MRLFRSRSRLAVLVLVIGLVAASCGDDDQDQATTTSSERAKGGTLVVGAEQEPDCADWIGSCAGSVWGYWTMNLATMPRAFEVRPDTSQVPSPLLDGEPELETGPPMKVTYRLNPRAVWSDGTPITSSDFKYTWQQITTGQDIADPTGYEQIENVDDADPKTAVVTFGAPFAAWRDLFGGFYGVLPRHLLEGKDRAAEMQAGYRWSGGPWLMEWSRGQEIRLVPNPRYWDRKPNLDAVVFRFLTDTPAEIQDYRSGQVKAVYPQTSSDLGQLRRVSDSRFLVSPGLGYEVVFFNTESPPLDSKAVRQALAHATDRQVIVRQLFRDVDPGLEPTQALVSPGNREWYPPDQPFRRYSKNLDRVEQLMEGDGWAKGPDGIWAKGQRRAVIESSTVAGNKGRENMQQLLQSQWKEAGFELKVNNTTEDTLFGEWFPQGSFQSAIVAPTPSSTDPGLCSVLCSKNIPSPENETGTNYTRIKSPQLDRIWQQVDTELDVKKRKQLADQGQAVAAEEVPALPIAPVPDVVVYNEAVIKGPVGNNVLSSPFWNIHLWYCAGGKC